MFLTMRKTELFKFTVSIGASLMLAACSDEGAGTAERETPGAAAVAPANYDADIGKVMAVFENIDNLDALEESLDIDALRAIARDEKEAFVSAMMAFFKEEHADAHAVIRQMALNAGYDSLEAFERDGNAVFQAVAITTFAKIEAATYEDISGASKAGRGLWLESGDYAPMARMIYAVPKSLLDAVEPHYDYLVIDKGAADPAVNPELVKYYGYLALLPDMMALTPEPHPDDFAAYDAMADATQPMSSLVAFLTEQYPGDMAILPGMVSSYGFESLDDWASMGDRIAVGMAVAGMKRDTPEEYQRAMTISDEELSALDELEQFIVASARNFSESERAFFDANFDRYQTALKGR